MPTSDPEFWTLPDLREAACLTWVQEVAPGEALRRMGAPGPYTPRSLAATAAANLALYGKVAPFGIPFAALAGKLGGGWTLLVEPNGGQGEERLARIAAGAAAVCVCWNINAAASVSVVDDNVVSRLGDIVSCWVPGDGGAPHCGPADVEGDPAALAELVTALAAVDRYDWKPAVFDWVERRVGLRTPSAWFGNEHLSAVYVGAGRGAVRST